MHYDKWHIEAMESPLEMLKIDWDMALHSLGSWLCFDGNLEQVNSTCNASYLVIDKNIGNGYLSFVNVDANLFGYYK